MHGFKVGLSTLFVHGKGGTPERAFAWLHCFPPWVIWMAQRGSVTTDTLWERVLGNSCLIFSPSLFFRKQNHNGCGTVKEMSSEWKRIWQLRMKWGEKSKSHSIWALCLCSCLVWDQSEHIWMYVCVFVCFQTLEPLPTHVINNTLIIHNRSSPNQITDEMQFTTVITSDHWIPGFRIDWCNTLETFPLQTGNGISHKMSVLRINLCFPGPPWCLFCRACLFVCTCISINSKNHCSLFKWPAFCSENSLHLKSPKSGSRYSSYISDTVPVRENKQDGWVYPQTVH